MAKRSAAGTFDKPRLTTQYFAHTASIAARSAASGSTGAVVFGALEPTAGDLVVGDEDVAFVEVVEADDDGDDVTSAVEG